MKDGLDEPCALWVEHLRSLPAMKVDDHTSVAAGEDWRAVIEKAIDLAHANSIPYHFAMSGERSIHVYRGSVGEGGLEAGKFAHGIRLGGGAIWKPKKLIYPSGFLQTDFLLVSRLPASPLGGAVVLLSGGHGVGTRRQSRALRAKPI